MPDTQGPLERLRRKLYGLDKLPPVAPPALSSTASFEEPGGWKPPEHELEEEHHGPLSGPALFLVIAAGFFVVAAVVATVLLLYGSRSVSTDHIDVRVDGPTTIASGDTVSLQVAVTNRNPVSLTDTNLTIDLPDGTRSASDATQPLAHYSDTLGTLAPGAAAERTVKAVFFGAENQTITVPVTLEYKTEGSNAVFVKKAQLSFTVTTSPISVTIATLSETASGQPLSLTIAVRSNATTPLHNIAVLGEYPFGFAMTSSNPTPTAGSLFMLGDLNPGEERDIQVSGTLTGQNNEQRVFRFTAGTAKADGSAQLAVPYTSKEADIAVTQPFLNVGVSVNHVTDDSVVITPGSPVQAILSWTNTLTTPIQNAQVTVKISGNALNPSSISATNGFYQSSDSTVVFDSSTSNTLANLQAGDSGGGSISFNTKTGDELAGVRNPTVTLAISIAGTRMSQSQVPESISSTLTRTIRVATAVDFSSRILHTAGSITNSGPWPPTPGKETTYSVVWMVTNTVNSVADGTVIGTLPPYVRFTGTTQPNDGSITYNDTTHQVTWHMGDVQPGGIGRQASFQIALLPSTSQSGTSPILISDQQFSGTDRFTSRALVTKAPQLDTRTSSDPAYVAADSVVTK